MRIVGRKFGKAKRAAFLAAARGFLGATWRHQGRRPDAMDCLGLVALSLAAIGVPVRDRKGYGRTPYNGHLAQSLREHFGAPVDDLQPGDVVTMKWAGEENHVAIVTDHPEGLGLIHCYAAAPGIGGGRVVEHRLSDDFRARIHEGFRP